MLSKYACLDEYAYRLNNEQEDIRTPFFRDIDRIIYSLSYIRYIDKTQVFSNNNNDHVSKRIIHVQFVSKIARTIGRMLKLNEDLIEAASLGHDLGHVPFGHLGESFLNEICIRENLGYFSHNVQSVRMLMNLENNGCGRNITVQVLDAILCHNGEKLQQKYTYKHKTKDEFIKEYEACYKDKKVLNNLVSMTLEGCVVRICDVIGYVGRDLEDGIRLGLIKKDDIPKKIKEILGVNNREIINTIVLDIIENSQDKPFIMMSDKVYNALNILLEFNYKNIYYKVCTKEEIEKYKNMFNNLYQFYLNEINSKNTNSDIYTHFLDGMSYDYITKTSNKRIVIDYISGMTDDYFKEKCAKYL